MENRIFKYALITSFLVHTFVLLVLWLTDIHYRRDIEKASVEVVYQAQVVEERPEHKIVSDLARGLKQDKNIPLPKILRPKDEVPPPMFQQTHKEPLKLDVAKRTDIPIKGVSGKRQIKIPILDSDKVMGSHYMTYHEQVRDKIRNRAYFYVDDPQFESGEVYLTFVLGSDGGLKAIKIIDDKTRANSYLRSVGLRSIKESAPFPPFPKDLDYPELTFNVVISFEVGK